jgi:hypothetical protein
MSMLMENIVFCFLKYNSRLGRSESRHVSVTFKISSSFCLTLFAHLCLVSTAPRTRTTSVQKSRTTTKTRTKTKKTKNERRKRPPAISPSPIRLSEPPESGPWRFRGRRGPRPPRSRRARRQRELVQRYARVPLALLALPAHSPCLLARSPCAVRT